MRYASILFDLDGTLIRTPLSYVADRLNKVLSDMGIPPVLEKEAAKFWFAPDIDAVVNRLTSDSSRFWQLFRKYDDLSNRIGIISVYQDVHFLQELNQSNISLGVITSAQKEIANKELTLLNSIKFGSIVYAQPIYGVKSKPDPEAVGISIKRLRVSPEKTAYVGNGIEDMMTAKNAGIDSFFLERPEYPYCLGLEPTKRIKSLAELREFIF